MIRVPIERGAKGLVSLISLSFHVKHEVENDRFGAGIDKTIQDHAMNFAAPGEPLLHESQGGRLVKILGPERVEGAGVFVDREKDKLRILFGAASLAIGRQPVAAVLLGGTQEQAGPV